MSTELVSGNINIAKMVEAIESKLDGKKRVIDLGDRVIYLNPVNRKYCSKKTCFDIVFVNKSKGVKINCMSFEYETDYHTHGGNIHMFYGVRHWFKGDELMNETLRGYTREQQIAFDEFITKAIFKELGI